MMRAVTNNKGIMCGRPPPRAYASLDTHARYRNGIDAVALATGQDVRAIESAAHAYAAYIADPAVSRYRPLAQYAIEPPGAPDDE